MLENTNPPSATQQDHLILLCKSCDLPIHHAIISSAKQRAVCPRCDTKLYELPYGNLNMMLALCLSALVLFIPANLLPIIYLEFLGSLRQTTIFEAGVSSLVQGFPIVGISVILTAIVAPGLLLLSILVQILIVKWGLASARARQILCDLLKLHQLLTQLSMLEIYLIGLLVTAFQLSTHTEISFGFGALCFSFLLVINIFLIREYSLSTMWRYLDHTVEQAASTAKSSH